MNKALLRTGWVVLLIPVIVPRPSWAQAVIPAPLNGDMPAVTFQSEGKLTNAVVGTVSASTVLDDNINSSTTRPISGMQYDLGTSIAFQQTRRRVTWGLTYSPSVDTYTHTTGRNLFNQFASASLQYDPTNRFSVRLRQDYLVSTNPFQQLGGGQLEPSLGILNRPNDSIVLPRLRRTALFSIAALTYRLTRHTTVGAGGSFADQHYSNFGESPSVNGLSNNRSTIGSTFLAHELSARQTSGIEYRLLNLETPQLKERTIGHSILYFHQIAVTAHMTFVLFAGPEYLRSHDQLSPQLSVVHTAWLPAAGAIYTINGVRTAFQVNYLRRVSDGGGSLGAVRMNLGSVQLRRQIARRWTADFTFLAAQNDSLNSDIEHLRTVNAGAGLSHEIIPNMSLRLSYERFNQSGNPSFGNHNRLMLSLAHSFKRPIGR
jgi:hypothetical protein